ncbi:hypothetical protein JHK87_004368 [Glycine soja]|nr:hypothetical protein JHK87_004368 [Glycine soja]
MMVAPSVTRIEASKELTDIETQRKQEANEFSFKLESTRRKLKEAIEEIDESKELEMKLFMASLDVIRNELKHVTAETNRLKKKEGKVDSTVQNLNFKILRAKSKLEAVSAAEEKARSIVMSLSHTLEKLKTKTEEAKKENEDVSQEVAATNEYRFFILNYV